MARYSGLNRAYEFVKGMNKSTLVNDTVKLSGKGAGLAKGYRAAQPTKSARSSIGGTMNPQSTKAVDIKGLHKPNPVGQTDNVRINKNHMEMDSTPGTRSNSRGPNNSYNLEAVGRKKNYNGNGPGSVPSAKPPTAPRSHGPGYNIPEHMNAKGARSVLSEAGPGTKLWGNSMNNFDQAGGFARLGTSAVRGAMLGGVTGGVFEGATGGDFWEGAKSGAMYGGLGAGARRGVRSMSGATKGQGTMKAVNQHMKSQYPEGWSKSALAMVKNKQAAEMTKKANGLK